MAFCIKNCSTFSMTKLLTVAFKVSKMVQIRISLLKRNVPIGTKSTQQYVSTTSNKSSVLELEVWLHLRTERIVLWRRMLLESFLLQCKVSNITCTTTIPTWRISPIFWKSNDYKKLNDVNSELYLIKNTFCCLTTYNFKRKLKFNWKLFWMNPILSPIYTKKL